MAKNIHELAAQIDQFVKDRNWEQFHSPKNLAMALSVEVAELCEIFQWSTDRESRNIMNSKREEVRDELADVFIYLLRMSRVLKVDLLDCAESKLRKNEAKYPTEVVKGSAKKYSDYPEQGGRDE